MVYLAIAVICAVIALVMRPMMADETTLGNAIGYFIKLIEESTHGQITLVPTVKQ